MSSIVASTGRRALPRVWDLRRTCSLPLLATAINTPLLPFTRLSQKRLTQEGDTNENFRAYQVSGVLIFLSVDTLELSATEPPNGAIITVR